MSQRYPIPHRGPPRDMAVALIDNFLSAHGYGGRPYELIRVPCGVLDPGPGNHGWAFLLHPLDDRVSFVHEDLSITWNGTRLEPQEK